MMLFEFGLGLLGNLLASKLYDLGRSAVGKLDRTPAVRRAIDETAAQFPDLELKSLLKIWCSSDSFQSLIEKGKAPDGVDDESVLSSFLTLTQFDDEWEVARKVLSVFFAQLQKAVLDGPSGTSEHDVLEAQRHATTQAVVTGESSAVKREIQELRREMLELRDDALRRPAEEMWNWLVDEARKKLQSGEALIARALLESVRRQTKGQSVSDELNFRLATNLGGCAVQLGDEEATERELENALRFQPESVQALSNGAVAAYLRRDDVTAIERSERALALQSCDANALSIKIQALWRHAPERLESFVAEAAECLKITPIAQLALATVRGEQGNWREARRLARAAAKGAPDHPDTHQIYSQCIVFPLRSANLADPPVKISRFTTKSLCLAERAQSTAIDLLREHPNRAAYGRALNDRAAIRLMRGDVEGCLEDCETILRTQGFEPEMREAAQQQKGIALIRVGRDAEAVSVLESLQDPTLRRQVTSALAFALLRLKRPDRVIIVVSPYWQPRRDDREQLDFAEYLLEAYRLLGNREKVAQIVREIEDVWDDDPDAASVLAAHLQREGDAEGARNLFEAAHQAAVPGSRAQERITRDLAEMLFRQQKYDEALPFFEAIVDASTAYENSTLAHYLVALFYSQERPGALQQALDIARSLRECEGVSETVSEVEANLLHEAGRIAEARQIFLELARLNPQHHAYKLRAIQLAILLEEHDTARAELATLDTVVLWSDAKALMYVAEFRAFLKMPDALHYAYRALRLGFGEADMHRAYISLFLNITRDYTGEEPGPLDSPSKVIVNSGVRLQREREKRAYVILADGPYHEDRGELAPNHTIAEKLLGRRRGDRVTLGVGPHEARFEVAEILHPYVLAFQESITHFSEWFAENRTMMTLHVGEDEAGESDFSEMFSILDDRHRFMSGLLELYRDWKIPFCFFAQHSSRSVFEVWDGLRVERDGGIHSDRGHVSEDEDARLLPRTSSLVLDATALITASQLGLMEAVKKRFERLIVPLALAQEIRDAAIQIENDPTAGTIGRGRDGYFHYEYSPEQQESWRGFVRGVRDVMEAQAEIVSTFGSLSLARKQHRELQESLGESALESLLVTQDNATAPDESSTLLWSDDAGLREIGRDLFKIKGVSTFGLLAELWRSEVLTRDQFFEAWQRLILLGYRFLPVSPEFLAWTLERENFHITAEVRAVFASLQPPTIEESAIEAAAETLKIVWQQKPLHPRDLETLDLCLDVVTTGRDTWRVTEGFKQALNSPSRFGLLPLERERIGRAIRGWERAHVQAVDRRLILPPPASQPNAPTSRRNGQGHNSHYNGRNAHTVNRPQSGGAAEFGGVRVHVNDSSYRIGDEGGTVAEHVETEHHSLVEATQQVADGVVCLLSALQFHVLTTQNPFEVWLAVSENTPTPPESYPPLRLITYPVETLTEGVEEYVIEGVTVRVTNPARTAVDCFRFRNEVGLDVALEALRDCRRERKGTAAEFGRYARLWGVENDIRPYLESLFH